MMKTPSKGGAGFLSVLTTDTPPLLGSLTPPPHPSLDQERRVQSSCTRPENLKDYARTLIASLLKLPGYDSLL